MAGYAIGRVDGRATALTVILPLKWYGRTWLTVWFGFLRLPFVGRWAFKKLDRLRFVSAIRWSLLPPFVPQKSPFDRDLDQRWQLLFESNFDGDWDEYLDSFGSVMGGALKSIIRPGAGYPSLKSPSLFKDYARIHDHTPHGYVSSYPTLTAGDIRQEILARYGEAAKKAIVKADFGRTSPQWTTFLVPIRPGRTGAVTDATVALEEDVLVHKENALLLTTGRIHFARVAILDRPSGSWLLTTLTHDGPVEPILQQMVAADAKAAPDKRLLRALLECLQGVPVDSVGWWDDQALVDFLLAHRPAASNKFVAYCGYPGFTVRDIVPFVDERTRDDRWPSAEVLR
ncbi:MAG: hypothetical protein QOD63_1419 [Actinomycetota bacterium]|nr:hypothetical protein [Actinomycetota bacterium]